MLVPSQLKMQCCAPAPFNARVHNSWSSLLDAMHNSIHLPNDHLHAAMLYAGKYGQGVGCSHQTIQGQILGCAGRAWPATTLLVTVDNNMASS